MWYGESPGFVVPAASAPEIIVVRIKSNVPKVKTNLMTFLKNKVKNYIFQQLTSLTMAQLQQQHQLAIQETHFISCSL